MVSQNFGTLFLASLITLSTSLHAEKPLNVVLILVDDLGYADLACYGNDFHETPHLDQLASEGLRFTNNYAACAVCSPTRAALQTGQYPTRFGITDWIPGYRKRNPPLKEKHTERLLPLEAITIAEALKAHHYRTAHIGKWHLLDKDHKIGFPEDQGYDLNLGGFHKGQPPAGYFAPFKFPNLPAKPDDNYLTDRIGDEAVNYINQQGKEGDEPFFLMLSFYSVHTPIQPRPDLKAHYEEKLKTFTPTYWNHPAYASMVHSMDHNVGRVLTALSENNFTDNTLVVFTSDNGGLTKRNFTSCHPLREGKGFHYEGGIRVPLILRLPGTIKPNTRSHSPAISQDLFPTILDLAKLPLQPDNHCDGLSLRPVINGQALNRDTLFWHYPHYHTVGETPVSVIRKGDYKFIRHYEGLRKELYNLSSDIGETKNLLSSHPDKARELEELLDKWLTEQNAYIPQPAS